MRRRTFLRLAGSAGAGLLPFPAVVGAQAPWPNKPVKMVVPFGAGGGTDNLARYWAERLSQAFGQPFVIENRGGASGVIGTEAVAKSPPDGYTLLLSSNSPIVNLPLLRKVPYEPSSLLPVVRVGDAVTGSSGSNSSFHCAAPILEVLHGQSANLLAGNDEFHDLRGAVTDLEPHDIAQPLLMRKIHRVTIVTMREQALVDHLHRRSSAHTIWPWRPPPYAATLDHVGRASGSKAGAPWSETSQPQPVETTRPGIGEGRTEGLALLDVLPRSRRGKLARPRRIAGQSVRVSSRTPA